MLFLPCARSLLSLFMITSFSITSFRISSHRSFRCSIVLDNSAVVFLALSSDSSRQSCSCCFSALARSKSSSSSCIRDCAYSWLDHESSGSFGGALRFVWPTATTRSSSTSSKSLRPSSIWASGAALCKTSREWTTIFSGSFFSSLLSFSAWCTTPANSLCKEIT